MRRRYILIKSGVAKGRKFWYIKPKRTSNHTINEKEGELMTEIVNKINNIQLPPHVLRELGLSKDWKKDISPEFLQKVIRTAEKYKEVLRELSKY